MIMSRFTFAILAVVGVISPLQAQTAVTESLGMALTAPQIAVPLLFGSSIQPVMGTLVGRTLFYSAAYTKGTCIGRGLYAFNLGAGKRQEQQVSDVACVESVQTDGERLLALVRRELKGKRELLQWDQGEMKSAMEGQSRWSAALNWRRHQMQQTTGVPWLKNDPEIRLFSLALPGTISLVFSQPSGAELMLFQYQAAGKKTGTSSVRKIELSAQSLEATSFATDDKQQLYIPIQGETADHPDRIALLPMAGGQQPQMLGGESPYTEAAVWNHLPAQGEGAWMMRSARVAAVGKGVLVHARTEYQNEWNALAYYDPDSNSFSRVDLPQELVDGVEGVSVAEAGLLLSYPQSRQIVWFGKKSPFAPSFFPPRDLQLRVLEEEDREEVTVKEGKK